MRITFFAPTVIGYLAWPDALYARGLASALACAGHDVRVLEERRNRYFVETLRGAGAQPVRHFDAHFPHVQHHTYEPLHGARLLEWVAREVALLDVAVVVAGADDELTGWVANLTRAGLTRVFLAFDALRERPHALNLSLFDGVLAPYPVDGAANWRFLPRTIAPADGTLAPGATGDIVSGSAAAAAFNDAIAAMRAPR